MNNKFSKKYIIKKELTPQDIFHISQDVASIHGDELGIGIDTLMERNILWILMRSKYVISRLPKKHEEVEAITWPHPYGKMDSDRDVLFLDKDGKELIRLTQKWIIYSREKTAILPMKDIDPKITCLEDTLFPDLRGLKIDAINGKTKTFKIKKKHLDQNKHLNNIRYIDFIMNSIHLSKKEYVKELEINFLKECLLGDIIKLTYQRRDNEILVLLYNGGDISMRARLSIAMK